MSCPYQDILGVPNQGVHSYRILNIAMFDVGLLILFAILLKLIVSLFVYISYPFAFLLSFLLGIIIHRILCVRTTIDIWLFP